MENIIGERMGKLIIEEYVGKDKVKGRLYMCVCDCGMDRILSKSQLAQYKSCGCHRQRNGSRKHAEYTVWRKMKERCYNKNQDGYQYYGGKGIKVCDEWRNSFTTFLNDMGKRPSKNHEIDRINSDDDYKPSNCRWITHSENMINRKSKNGKLRNIYKRESGKYRVSISRDKNVYLSKQFDNIDDAISHRDEMLELYNNDPKTWNTLQLNE